MTHSSKGLSSFTLRNVAMILMLIDHIGSTFFPESLWLRYIGRLAFPIFAFLIVEGYFHTKNFTKYLLRLLLLAFLTDVPYQLMINKTWNYVPFQNVIWTFIISLVAIWMIDKCHQHLPKLITIVLSLVIILVSCFLADYLQTDYHSWGVLTIIGFYFFRGENKIGQAVVLLLINLVLTNLETAFLIGFENISFYWEIYGFKLLSPQMYAPLALILIWFYNGRVGKHSKLLQLTNYLFYPVHMLLLGLATFL